MKTKGTYKLLTILALASVLAVCPSCSKKQVVHKNKARVEIAEAPKKVIDFGDIPRQWAGLTFSHTDYIRFKQCGMELPSLELEERDGDGFVHVNTGKNQLVYNVKSVSSNGKRFQIQANHPEMGDHVFEFRYTEEDRKIGIWTSINYNNIKTDIDYIIASKAENIKLLEDKCEEDKEEYKTTITTLFQE